MSLNLIALIEIVDNIYTNIDSSNILLVFFLTCGRLLTLQIEILLCKLYKYGVRGVILYEEAERHVDKGYMTKSANF